MLTRLQNLVYILLLGTTGLLMSDNAAAQLIPVGDINTNNWTPTALTPNLEADDDWFISSPLASHAQGEVMMSDDIEPGLYTLFTVRVLARKMPDGAGPTTAVRGLIINVRINGALLGEQEIINLTNDFTIYSFVFGGSFTHENLLTLQVLFATNGRTTGQNLRQAQIDYIDVVLPDPIPLPVKLKSFTASRKQANVELSWVTAMEQNNSGFELQRQSGAGGWQTLAFVASQSANGNSNSDLRYFYNDANNSKGVTQYRLKQLDLDNKYVFSQVRAVHGMSQSGRTMVAPNPSSNGSLNVLFETAGERDLLLTDMAGRIMRQWNNYADNSLQISNLAPGNYQLRIINRETKTQSVEKIMVTSR